MLTNKDKVWVGDQPIEYVEHFAHDGDEGDGFGFTGGDEAGVEGARRVALAGGAIANVERKLDPAGLVIRDLRQARQVSGNAPA